MAVMAFIPSEQFRLEQRVDQIDEQTGGHERSERVIKNHGFTSSQVLASVDIGDRRGEEADRKRHHHEVHHGIAPDEIFKLQIDAPAAGDGFDIGQNKREDSRPLRAISALERIGIRGDRAFEDIGIP